jgi:acyl carrier protein
VLELDQVSIDDNFFDIGGHSLGAMRVLARVRRDFRVDVPIRILFDGPTIAELALEVEKRTTGSTIAPTVALTAEAPGSMTLLEILRAELSKLPPDQADAFLKSALAQKTAKVDDKS